MAIQYSCPHCAQLIEMDDEFAGRDATCPYCRSVGVVPGPAASAPAPVEPPRRRPPPLEERYAPRTPPPLSLHVGPPPPDRARRAAGWGNAALIVTVLSLLLIAGGFFGLFKGIYGLQEAGLTMPTERDAESMRKFQLEVAERAAKDPALSAAFVGGMAGMFLGLAGAAVAFALSVASLRCDVSGNWRGALSGVLSGMALLCVCGGALLGALFG